MNKEQEIEYLHEDIEVVEDLNEYATLLSLEMVDL